MRSILSVALAGLALAALPAAGRCDVLLSDFDGGGATPGQIFQAPDYSGSTDSNLAGSPSATAISTAQAFSGTHSLNVQYAFVDTSASRWLRLTANGSDPVIDATQSLTMKVYNAGTDPLSVALGVREVDYASNPALGSSGTGVNGTSRGIEWIGATGNGAPPNPTHTISAAAGWQDLTFNLASDPIQAFTGDGVLQPSFGKVNLEDLAFRSTGSAAPVNLFIDDIRIVSNTPAVPEPASLALLATGVLPLLARRKRR